MMIMLQARFPRFSRMMTMVVATALLTLGMVMVPKPATAHADTNPSAGSPATVSDDALPTWQVNGVVWSQVTIGNTVYAAGEFSQARPPGVAVGGAGSVNVGNLIAYNITTGNLITSFIHTLNAQALVVTKSPDNSRIYVGGDFTAVDGQARGHIAAFDVASGNLVSSFSPNLSGQVKALAATNTTVYAGGAFDYLDGTYRHHLAAMTASNGARTAWSPKTDNYVPWSMIMTPDQSKVVIAGQFHTLNSQVVDGLAAVDPTTGNLVPWAASTKIPNDTNGAVTGLSTDGTSIYGSGWAFGSGASFEGEFSLNPSDGSINWVNDCQGDTYNTYPMNGALYTVSHVHNCEMIGGLTQLSDWTINQKHALAFSTASSGQKNRGPDQYGWNYSAYDHSNLLTWYPNFQWGTYTQQKQSGWSITGNGDYMSVGGEFPSVNGMAQYGLVRFAVKGKAPNKMGPAACYNAPTPSARAASGGSARVSWQAASDPDNANLTYKVYRSGTSAPIYTTTQSNEYWNCPQMGYVDTGLSGGTSYTYKVTATDPFGNTYTMPTSNSVTAVGGSISSYAKDVLADGASAFWTLGESSGSVVYDTAGFNDGTASSGVSRGVNGPIAGDSTTASTFSGNSNGYTATNSTMPTTPSFTIETWIKTSTNSGGKIVGYGGSSSGDSGSYDRHVYMDNAGHVLFGVYPGSTQVVSSANTYNDGGWHHVVASLDQNAGMALYVDGKKVASNASVTTAQDYSGYWRIGGDSLNGWPSQPSSNYFSGTIGDVAIYPSALSLAQVQDHYLAGGGQLNLPATPTDTYGRAVYNSSPGFFWRLDESQGTTAQDMSRNQQNGTYSGGVTYGQHGALGSQGTAVTLDGSTGTIGSNTSQAAPSTYSEELWFNTTTTSGGNLIGFGDSQSGNSSSHDRHVFMDSAGRLTFGVWTGQITSITSPNTYNDGKWHYLVATQGANGMTLSVDGQQVANGPETTAQPYSGYWRVGGDTGWDGSGYFAGTIDEAAVYPTVLSSDAILAHYQAGGGTMPNQAPSAAFTSSVSDLKASFDGSGSTDPDGTIASYAWDFGDNSPAVSGAKPDHTYTAGGTYTVTLIVTDDGGATSTISHNVTVAAPPVNHAPVAGFSAAMSNLTASFTNSSSDPDGDTLSYAWDFGDGSTSTAKTPADHPYTVAGNYTVKLTVTDPGGLTDSVSHVVTATAAPPVNHAPVAGFSATMSNLTASFTNSSSDPDGDTLSYAWEFGDGSTSTAKTPADHPYTVAGNYTVKLTVTDPGGLIDSVSHVVTATAAPPVNHAPVAGFSATMSNLTASFTNSSSDPDGDTLSYAWEFGDGSTSTAKTPADHPYTVAGDYTVKLTVTDPGGLTDSVSHVVTATAQAPTALASDDFQRTLASGWGSLDKGGSWSSGSSGLSVNGSKALATFSAAGAGIDARVAGTSTSQADVEVQISTSKVQPVGSVYVYVVGRRVGVNDYRAKVLLGSDGKVYLAISRMNGGTEVATVPLQLVSGLTNAANTTFNVRFEATGTNPTTLRAKIWADGTSEPSAWQVQATDSTAALQASGTTGLAAYLSGNATGLPLALQFDKFRLYDASTLAGDAVAAKGAAKMTTKSSPTGGKLQHLTPVTKQNARELHALSKWGKF